MFKKEIKISNEHLLSRKDKDQLKEDLYKTYEKESVNAVFRTFEKISKLSVQSAKGGVAMFIFTSEQYPLFVDSTKKGDYFPTVYTASAFPDICGAIRIYEKVEEYIFGGAQLMWKGVMNFEEMRPFRTDDVRQVVASNGSVVAIGAMASTSEGYTQRPDKDQCCFILHTSIDQLTKLGDGKLPAVIWSKAMQEKIDQKAQEELERKAKEQDEREQRHKKEQEEKKKQEEQEDDDEDEEEEEEEEDNQIDEEALELAKRMGITNKSNNQPRIQYEQKAKPNVFKDDEGGKGARGKKSGGGTEGGHKKGRAKDEEDEDETSKKKAQKGGNKKKNQEDSDDENKGGQKKRGQQQDKKKKEDSDDENKGGQKKRGQQQDKKKKEDSDDDENKGGQKKRGQQQDKKKKEDSDDDQNKAGQKKRGQQQDKKKKEDSDDDNKAGQKKRGQQQEKKKKEEEEKSEDENLEKGRQNKKGGKNDKESAGQQPPAKKKDTAVTEKGKVAATKPEENNDKDSDSAEEESQTENVQPGEAPVGGKKPYVPAPRAPDHEDQKERRRLLKDYSGPGCPDCALGPNLSSKKKAEAKQGPAAEEQQQQQQQQQGESKGTTEGQQEQQISQTESVAAAAAEQSQTKSTEKQEEEKQEGDNESGEEEPTVKSSKISVGGGGNDKKKQKKSLDEKSAVSAGDDVDDQLLEAFLNAVKLSVDDKMLPMDPSLFYTQHLLPCKGHNVKQLDVKNSSYKKTGAFINHLKKEGLIEYKEAKKGMAPQITKINRVHKLIDKWEVTITRPFSKNESAEDAEDDKRQGGGDFVSKIEVEEYFKPTKEIIQIFEGRIELLQKEFSVLDVQKYLNEYIKLKCKMDKKFIVMDEYLLNLFPPGQSFGDEEEDNALASDDDDEPNYDEATRQRKAEEKAKIKQQQLLQQKEQEKRAALTTREDLWRKFQTKLKRVHVVNYLQHNHKETHNGPFPGLTIVTEKSHNKNITKIVGLEVFGLDLKALSVRFQNQYSCAVSTHEISGKLGGKELIVHGNFLQELVDFFTKESKINPRFIKQQDKLGTKKKKQGYQK